MDWVVLSLLAISMLTQEAFCCSGGSSKCTYSTCTTEWMSWSPSVPHGTCRWQYSKANHVYRSYTRSSGCPGSTKCYTKDHNRYACSCKVVTFCRWGSWGAYTGTIARGTCGTQRRYRYPTKTYRYDLKVGSCRNAVTTCPRESDSQSRQWCNCRQAERCDATQWTAWAGHVPNGGCAQQTSYRDFNPTYKYVQQLTNCHGIVSSCRSRQINSRSYCMCPSKHCVQQDWTLWQLITRSGVQCPSEERFRRWTYTMQYIGAHIDCNGIGTHSCPADSRQERKKAITCPKLTSPEYGSLVGAACDGVNSACGSICQLNCQLNYPLEGNSYATCKENGQWSNALGVCKDSIKPTIICPTKQEYPNIPNKDYAVVELPDATASDNSGKKPTVTINSASPLNVTVGKPVMVTYTATDAAGNQRSCSAEVKAKDVEPPKVVYCPKDISIVTDKMRHTVIWKEPEFSDNVDSSNALVIKPSIINGSPFSKGTTTVVKYIAHDKALNEVKCEFEVQVSEMKCKLYDAPKHGAYSCNVKKDGVEKLYMCSIACKNNYWFLQGENLPKLYDFYVCGDDGGWKGQNQIGVGEATFFNSIPKGSTPWPDCSEGSTPTEASKTFQVIGGNCNAMDIAKLKIDFVTALMTDPLITTIFCMKSTENCIVKNVKVRCSSVRKRSTGTLTNAVHISFDFYIQDKQPSNDQETEVIRMKKIISTMGQLRAEVAKIAQTQLKTIAANVILKEKSAELACDDGFIFSVVNGTGTVNARSKCVKCPAGTKYVAATKTCQVCTHGTYQGAEGQSTCKSCPIGYSTHGNRAGNFTSCKQICPPGTYSSTGLATCVACPKGTYQLLSNSTSCLTCPNGKGTTKSGSVYETDCEKNALHVKIRSEGCDDPGKTKLCGWTKIMVDGVDRSLHRRGYNLVVIDEKTGAFERSVSFDTHGSYSAGRQMQNFVSSLANGKIVIVGIQDEGSRFSTNDVDSALLQLHGSKPFQKQYRSAFAMLGYKGTKKPSWVRQLKTSRNRGPAILEYTIPLI